jgi:hypothetical protein
MHYNACRCLKTFQSAEVAEQADALRSGRSGQWPMRVQIPPSAPESLRGGAEVARQAHNLEVVGSNPTPATTNVYETAGSPKGG